VGSGDADMRDTQRLMSLRVGQHADPEEVPHARRQIEGGNFTDPGSPPLLRRLQASPLPAIKHSAVARAGRSRSR
jgi:hypothetical protein